MYNQFEHAAASSTSLNTEVNMAEINIKKGGKVEDSGDVSLRTVHRSNQGSTTITKTNKKHVCLFFDFTLDL